MNQEELRLRKEARKQVREEATKPITDHHTFEKLVAEKLEALMVEMVDTLDSNPSAERRKGSTPFEGI